MRFEVKGVFRKKNAERKYSKEIEAGSEALAREKLLSLIGSEHKVKRRFISISEIKPVEAAPSAGKPEKSELKE